jgi:predicted NAD/FAD-binding protein
MIDLGSRQVRREQIGRELNPAKRQVKRLRQRPHGARLGKAGDAFDEDVSTREQRDH